MTLRTALLEYTHLEINRITKFDMLKTVASFAKSDFYRSHFKRPREAHMLPRVTSSSGCCTAATSFLRLCNPPPPPSPPCLYCRGVACMSRMRRKHFKGGPRSSRPCLEDPPRRLSNSLNISGLGTTLENSFRPSRVSPTAWAEYRRSCRH